MINAQTPRVSIGMPVYNGGKHLEAALNDLTNNQTFKDVEIIISDNHSADNTAEICTRFAAADPRIQYFRQPETISATDNFNFVRHKATAPFFMWAAHDDTRSSDFIEKLLAALEKNDKAILAFGDIIGERQGVKAPEPLAFDNQSVSYIRRLHDTAVGQLHHLYGLWRREDLMKLDWKHNEWWHDTPPMMAAAMMGDFIHVPGPVFYYLYNKHPFFDAKPGVGFFVRRIGDLLRLIWLSIEAVTKAKGPLYGILAGMFTIEKIIRDTAGFICRRLCRKNNEKEKAGETA